MLIKFLLVLYLTWLVWAIPLIAPNITYLCLRLLKGLIFYDLYSKILHLLFNIGWFGKYLDIPNRCMKLNLNLNISASFNSGKLILSLINS